MTEREEKIPVTYTIDYDSITVTYPPGTNLRGKSTRIETGNKIQINHSPGEPQIVEIAENNTVPISSIIGTCTIESGEAIVHASQVLVSNGPDVTGWLEVDDLELPFVLTGQSSVVTFYTEEELLDVWPLKDRGVKKTD